MAELGIAPTTRPQADTDPGGQRMSNDLVRTDLVRRLVAEFLGTGLLVTVVVGSGIAAQRLSTDDVGLQLLENSTATFLGLTVLILMFGPVSGAHFNPVVSAADWLLGRRGGTGLTGPEVLAYSAVQVTGAIAGCGAGERDVRGSPSPSSPPPTAPGSNLWVGEVVATAGLVVLIFALARTGRGMLAAPAVGAYIGAAYWFTSSTSFANPAVTVGRVFSDTFAGIAPGSVPGFVVAQLVGGAVAVAVVRYLYPGVVDVADDVVVPHPHADTEETPMTATPRHRSACRRSCSPASATAAAPWPAEC